VAILTALAFLGEALEVPGPPRLVLTFFLLLITISVTGRTMG
jgi:hypothetical protein